MSVSLWIKLGVALAILAAVGGFWLTYSNMQHALELAQQKNVTLTDRANTLQGVNDANKLTIDKLEAARKADQAAVAKLSDAVGAVAAKADRTRTIIREVERNDPAAKALLDTPLPERVRNALNHTASN